MLSALLLSSTAVYADTAVDGNEPSGEVVVSETGNTSNDINSSTNLTNTVSGTDSIDNSNTDTTTEEAIEDTTEMTTETDTLEDAELNLSEETDVLSEDEGASSEQLAALLAESKVETGKDNQGSNDTGDDKSKKNDGDLFAKLGCAFAGHDWQQTGICSSNCDGKYTHTISAECSRCHETKETTVDCTGVDYTAVSGSNAKDADYSFHHDTEGHCETCGQAMKGTKACTPGSEITYVADKDTIESCDVNNSQKYHTAIAKCTDCGADVEVRVACTMGDFHYEKDKDTSAQNGTNHTLIAYCTTCNRAQTKEVACQFGEFHYEEAHDASGNKGKDNEHLEGKYHTEVAYCTEPDCGRFITKEVECNYADYTFVGRTENHKNDSIFNEYHWVRGTCECSRTEDVKEACHFVQEREGVFVCKPYAKQGASEGDALSEYECGNVKDVRKEDIVITLDYTDVDGNAITSADEYVKDGFLHRLYDQDIKVVATVYCQAFDNKDAKYWKKNMNINLYYSTPDKQSPKKADALVSASNGTAVYEWTISTQENTPVSIAGVDASYSIKEEYVTPVFKIPYYKEFKYSEETESGVILRPTDAKSYIDEESFDGSVQAGEWSKELAEVKWYSKVLKEHDNRDLDVTLKFNANNIIDPKDIPLQDNVKNGVKASKVTSHDAVSKPVAAQTPWSEKFTHDVTLSYDMTFSYTISADEDGAHDFVLSNSNLTDKKFHVLTYIDNVKPTYQKVKYTSAAERKNGKYYAKDVKVTVVAEDNNLDLSESKSYIYFDSENKTHVPFNASNATAETTASEDGKYVVKGVIYDKAGNSVEITDEKEFVVDKTVPTIKVNFDNHDAKHEKYYKADRTATFELYDLNIDANEADMSKVELKAKDGKATINKMDGADGKYVGTIVFDKDGVYKIGELKFEDKAGNLCKVIDGTDKDYNSEFVIDKTVPVITVEFDNNKPLNDIYYKAARKATITFKERNFSSEQVNIKKSSSEQDTLPELSSYSNNGDKNVTKIAFKQDGRYGFEVFTEDLAGNVSKTYIVDSFVIDLTAPEIEITGVTNKSANNGVVQPMIKSKDLNINEYSTVIKLTGSNNGVVQPSITQESAGTDTFTYSLADLAHEKKNDDLYTLSVKIKDFAGNEVEKKVQYSINRFGSIFVLSDATKSMVNGYYVTKPQDVVITEINVDSLAKKEVSLAYDGSVKELKEGSGFTTKDTTNSKGWHSISYTVGKSNFDKDGIYSVTVYSEDKASNRQSNQSKDAEIEFLLDKTAPSVIVSGIEDGGVYEEESHDFSINAADTIGVKGMTVYLNDNKLASYSASELSANGGTVVLSVPTKEDYQKVTIQCSDVAGNTTNLAYNNLLVSVKAEELLLEDELTPTSKMEEESTEVLEDTVKKASNAVAILLVVLGVAAFGGAGALVYKRKKH